MIHLRCSSWHFTAKTELIMYDLSTICTILRRYVTFYRNISYLQPQILLIGNAKKIVDKSSSSENLWKFIHEINT